MPRYIFSFCYLATDGSLSYSYLVFTRHQSFLSHIKGWFRLSYLQAIPHRHSAHSMDAVAPPSATNKVNVHPGPILLSMNCCIDTPIAATLQRTMLTDALAVAGLSGSRSKITVLQTLQVPVTVRPQMN